MYKYNEIQVLHLEVTSRCNAACPMCLRSIHGGALNPHLRLTEISLEDVKDFFPATFIKGLRQFYMCGNFGDPIAAKDTLEIFEYLRGLSPALRLDMFTNGSARPARWWKKLAQLGVGVRFAVDGLADTNAIYRRGTSFEKIIKNMKTFIDAGGRAEWDFIIFKHNEHQVEEARGLAESLGVKRFFSKKTGRFYASATQEFKPFVEVMDKKGNIIGKIEPPTEKKNVNEGLLKGQMVVEEHGSMEEYFEQTQIDCIVNRQKSVYVSAEGLVFPCCWTANQLYLWWNKDMRSTDLYKMINRDGDGLNSLSLRKHKLSSIVNGPFFQSRLPSSWNQKDRLRCCEEICGQTLQLYKSQFEPKSS